MKNTETISSMIPTPNPQSLTPAFLVEVFLKPGVSDPSAVSLLADFEALGLSSLVRISTARLYRIQGNYTSEEVAKIGGDLLADPVVQGFSVGLREVPGSGVRAEIWLKPQVMDPVSSSVEKGIRDLRLAPPEKVRCGTLVRFLGNFSEEELEKAVKKILVNPVIHQWTITKEVKTV